MYISLHLLRRKFTSHMKEQFRGQEGGFTLFFISMSGFHTSLLTTSRGHATSETLRFVTLINLMGRFSRTALEHRARPTESQAMITLADFYHLHVCDPTERPLCFTGVSEIQLTSHAVLKNRVREKRSGGLQMTNRSGRWRLLPVG